MLLNNNAKADGVVFSAQIEHVSSQGVEDSIPCSFTVKSSNTCVVGAGAKRTSGTRAVATSTDGTITIPQSVSLDGISYTVVGIQAYAFGGSSSTSCSKLEKIILPDTVTSFETYCFAFCTSLTSVSAPASLEIIADRAFYSSTSLGPQISFPSSLLSIGEYSFSKCKSLKTVIFEGDCPDVGNYAFSGGSVAIEKLVFLGASRNICTSDYFNSESASLPTAYYTVKFYNNEDDAKKKSNVIGSVTVSDKTDFGQIDCDLNDPKLVYSGAAPEWPEGTNLWAFEDTSSYSATISKSLYAYPIQSDYRDLSKASLEYELIDDGVMQYFGVDVNIGATLYNSVDYELDVSNFDVKYYRDGVETDDIISCGNVEIVVKAKSGSRYYGELHDTFSIVLQEGTSFASPVDVEGKSVDCWFSLNKLDTDDDGQKIGEVSLTNGSTVLYTEPNEKGQTELKYTKAVPQSTSGALKIPESISACGYNLKVVGIDAGALGISSTELKIVPCSLITELEIPAGVTRIDTAAFGYMTSLKKISFKGNASKIEWGDIIFKNDTNIEEAIWYGKKADNPYLFSKAETINTSIPKNYYQVTFYKDEDSVGTAEGKLGSAVLSEDVYLALIDSAKDKASGLYEGEIPAYPDTLIDDGTWYAPVWYFPEVSDDNSKALSSTLSDSVYAYAAQTNDAYTLDDAFIFGIEEGQEFSYTEEPVVSANDIAVSPACGRVLEKDKDYTIKFQRKDAVSSEWVDTDDVTNAGKMRLVVEGAGKYKDSRTVNFEISAPIINANQTFGADVTVKYDSGKTSTVKCGFLTRTASVNGSARAWIYPIFSYGALADRLSSNATLIIPDRIIYQGITFQITGISKNSFNNMFLGKEIVFPETIMTAESGAFSYVSSIKKVSLHGFQSAASGTFTQCTGIETLELCDDVTVLPSGFMTGATNIKTFTYSDNYIGKNAAFSGCKFETLHITKHMSEVMTAETFSGVSADTVIFDEGVTDIPQDALRNLTSCSKVSLPSTLKTIGAYSLSGLSAVTSIEIPDGVESIAENAFRACPKLETVKFLGDAPTCDVTSFMQCTKINSVLFCKDVSSNYLSVFTSNDVVFYCNIDFYASKADLESGNKLSNAFIKLGTKLSAIQKGTVASTSIYEGEIPALPDGTNLWEFKGNPCLKEQLKTSTYAFAKQVDLKSLENAFVISEDGYKYIDDKTAIDDPFDSGSANVYDALGDKLTKGTHYSITYQRRDANKQWQDTTDLASIGRVRIVAKAIDDGGYTDSCTGSFVITSYLVGETFVCNDVNGHAITYKVLTLSDDVDAGSVAVGRGQRSYQAVDNEESGCIVIPKLATDSNGFKYKPVTVSNYAFYRCMDITQVQLPASITTIGKMAFAYVSNKTDTKVSNLNTLVFGNDMSKTDIAADAFNGCDDIQTVVYKSKKGSFNAFGNSTDIQYYYTVSYYSSKADFLNGASPEAVVTSKAGSYPYSLSASDYYEGSDKAPELNKNQEWFYEPGALGQYDELIDSLYAYAYTTDESIVIADVEVKTLLQTKNVECQFKRKQNEQGEYTNKVVVGQCADGNAAIDLNIEGTIVIPSKIKDSDGKEYDVEGIGSYAFGASTSSQACTKLEGVEIPSTITSIDQAAFANCTSLKNVKFAQDSTLQSIGSSAFLNCTSLQNIDLPKSLQTIAASAFSASSLESVYIPASVLSIGKRAFNSCSSLKYVVFGAAMELKLDAQANPVALSSDDVEKQAGASSNMSALKLVDDYVFAECASLVKIVFNADMSKTTISECAFENSKNIESVLFGDKSCDVPLPGSGADGQAKEAKIYYTMSYFHRAQDLSSLKRMGYVCVLANTSFAARDASTTLFGTEPQIEQHYEWVYACDTEKALEDSSYAYGAKIVFKIDLSQIDDAFDIEASVNGEAAKIEDDTFGATYEDAVVINVTSSHNVQPGVMHIMEAESGAEFANFDNSSVSFTMGDKALKVSVEPTLSLNVNKENAKGIEVSSKDFSYSDLVGLCTTADEAIAYSLWDKMQNACVLNVKSYVSLSDLFKAAGVSFEEGDSLVFYSGSKMLETISYKELYSEQRNYYPDFRDGSTENAQEREPIFALTSNEQIYDSSESSASSISLAYACRFIYGQTKDDVLDINNTYSICSKEITNITILAGPENIKDFTVSGIEDTYEYSGEAIAPDFELIASDGSTLQDGVDYEFKFSNNTDPGFAILEIEGIGAFKGSIKRTFKIIDAREYTGASSAEAAAEVALDSFDSGCSGAVIANAYNLTQLNSAPSLCGLLNYPLLLTDSNKLSQATQDALKYLSSNCSEFQVIILGNSSDVSASVESAIKSSIESAAQSGASVDVSRLGGKDAYETAYLTYLYGSMMQNGWSSTVLVTSGEGYSSAACASAFAAANNIPVLCAKGSSLDDLTLEAVNDTAFKNAIVVGGEDEISSSIYEQLVARFGTDNVTRIAGSSTAETSYKLNEYALNADMLNSQQVAVALDGKFPDAFVAAASSAKSGGMLIVVDSDCTQACELLKTNASDVCLLNMYGNILMLTQDMRESLCEAIGWDKSILPEPAQVASAPEKGDPNKKKENDNSSNNNTAARAKAGTVFTIGKLNFTVQSNKKEVAISAKNKKVKKVIIPSTIKDGNGFVYKVTSVAKGGFASCNKLKQITGGSNIKKIGAGAFKNCSSLKFVASSSKKLEAIGSKAFYNCKKLIGANFSKSTKLKSIGKNAFYNTKNLASIKISKTKVLKTVKNAFKKAGKASGKKLIIDVKSSKAKAYKKLILRKGGNKKVGVK